MPPKKTVVKVELLQNFERDLTLRRRSDRTIQGYRSNIKEFLQFYPQPETVTYDDLEEYLMHLLERDLKTSTLKSTFSAISSFYEYLIYKKVVDRNPITGFRKRYIDNAVEPDRRQILEISQARSLISTLDFIREIAIIVTLAKTGIRREELLLLTVDDIDLEKDIIIIERKKRAKNRIRFIDPELHAVLEEYLFWREGRKAQRKCKTNYLWISDRGGRIHKDYPNEFIQYHAQKLGLHDPRGPLETKLSCHCFRGFMTTHLRRAGMKEEHITTMLGHSLKMATWSGHYLDIDMGIVREEYLRCVPQLLDS